MIFNKTQKFPFDVYRITHSSGDERILITGALQGGGSFNFNAQDFLASFQLSQKQDVSGKHVFLLEFIDESIVLATGLSETKLREAQSFFISKLGIPTADTMSQIKAPAFYRKKRYAISFLAITVGAFLFWPVQNPQYVEISDPEILALIDAKSNAKNTVDEKQAARIDEASSIAQMGLNRESRKEGIEQRIDFIKNALLEDGTKERITTNGYLSSYASQAVHIAAANFAVPFGDMSKEGNIPYLVFSSPTHEAVTSLISSTEQKGFTPIVIPVDYAESDWRDGSEPVLRVIASYCSNQPILMWNKKDITTEDLVSAFEDNGGDCDWQSALTNFSSAWGIASSDSAVKTPFIVAPNGAIFQANDADKTNPDVLVRWLEENPLHTN